MAKIRNMGTSTMRFNEGLVISGSISTDYASTEGVALVCTGSLEIAANSTNDEVIRIMSSGDQREIMFEAPAGGGGGGSAVAAQLIVATSGAPKGLQVNSPGDGQFFYINIPASIDGSGIQWEYRVQSSLNSVPSGNRVHIKIGADNNATEANIISAINGTTDGAIAQYAGATVGNNGVITNRAQISAAANGSVTNGIDLTSTTAGTAGNDITFEANQAGLSPNHGSAVNFSGGAASGGGGGGGNTNVASIHTNANYDLILSGAGSIELKTGPDERVFIMSGSSDAPGSPNESNATDINFFVSGSMKSKGTTTKGTAVFGGDLLVSGNISENLPYSSIYKDVLTYFSGSKGSKGTDTRGLAMFGGDAHVSGSFYTKQISDVIRSRSVKVNTTTTTSASQWLKILDISSNVPIEDNRTVSSILLLTLTGGEVLESLGTDATYLIQVKYTADSSSPYYKEWGTSITVDPLNADNLDGFDPTTDIYITFTNSGGALLPEVFVKSMVGYKSCFITHLGGSDNNNYDWSGPSFDVPTKQSWLGSGLNQGTRVFGNWSSKKLSEVTVTGNASVDGALRLKEMSAPGITSGYGKVYVGSDNKLYYKDENSATYDLTAGGGVWSGDGTYIYPVDTNDTVVVGNNNSGVMSGPSMIIAGNSDITNPTPTLDEFNLVLWNKQNYRENGIAFVSDGAINGSFTPGASITHSGGASSNGGLNFRTKATQTDAGDSLVRMKITDDGIVNCVGGSTIAAGNNNGRLSVGATNGTDGPLVFDKDGMQSKNSDGNSKPIHINSLGTVNNGKPHVYIGTNLTGRTGGSYTDHLYSVHIYTSSISADITNTCYALKVRHDTDTENVYTANYGGIQIQCGRDSPSSDGSAQWINFLNGAGGFEGSIRYSNSDGGANIFQSSDERIKYDIADTNINALNKLNQINLKEFRKNKNNISDPGTSIPLTPIGFIAQDVERALPNLVSETEYDYGLDHHIKSLSQSSFIPYLVKAVQELSAKNDELEARIKALEDDQ